MPRHHADDPGGRDVQEYDLYIPHHYNDGTPVEEEKIAALKKRLTRKFGGLTFFPQRNEGTWTIGNVLFRDEIVIFRILAEQTAQARAYFARLKEELRAELQQEEILIVERQARVL